MLNNFIDIQKELEESGNKAILESHKSETCNQDVSLSLMERKRNAPKQEDVEIPQLGWHPVAS